MPPTRTIPTPGPIPGQPQVRTSAPASQVPVACGPAGVHHILLIDSESGHRERLSHCLRAKGFTVETCLDVRDAVRKLKQNSEKFAVVILYVSDLSGPWTRILHTLEEASEHSRPHIGPLYLCDMKVKGLPHLRLSLEHLGARVAYERRN